MFSIRYSARFLSCTMNMLFNIGSNELLIAIPSIWQKYLHSTMKWTSSLHNINKSLGIFKGKIVRIHWKFHVD